MNKNVNENKFAFIICTNDDIYLQECFHYLNRLIVPSGYETDILTIYEAKSMTAGYNEGMVSTDAKYKIYMHQDVFITNQYFLSDILSIFQTDSSIGMIGMVGYPVISRTGLMWHETRIGAQPLYGEKQAYSNADFSKYRYSLSDGISDVALIDGLMMITAYDLPWNEAELKDWDFYDAFQSMNFLLNGYKIVVPVQTLPWFIHDDGKILAMWNYNKYRHLFMEKYKDYLGKSYLEII
ncbi:MAG: glycosyltransferase family protein [Lachnospiraceae bacterium]|nr:glycosyltransferase family protein [Lachnospiraceae bacterium]